MGGLLSLRLSLSVAQSGYFAVSAAPATDVSAN
jgi:hypothetical protein